MVGAWGRVSTMIGGGFEGDGTGTGMGVTGRTGMAPGVVGVSVGVTIG